MDSSEDDYSGYYSESYYYSPSELKDIDKNQIKITSSSPKDGKNKNDNFEQKQGTISAYLNIPKDKSKDDFSTPSTLNSISSLPDQPEIDLMEIHAELKNIYIDPYDLNPASRQVQRYPTIFDDVQNEASEMKMPDWRSFQLDIIPEYDVTKMTELIHQRFDITLLVEIMRKT